VIDVTNRTDVNVRLVTCEFFLRHDPDTSLNKMQNVLN